MEILQKKLFFLIDSTCSYNLKHDGNSNMKKKTCFENNIIILAIVLKFS